MKTLTEEQEKLLREQAEIILNENCSSVIAWSHNRKESTIKAMLEFGKSYKSLLNLIPCECQYPFKKKNYDECESCGGKYSNRKNRS